MCCVIFCNLKAMICHSKMKRPPLLAPSSFYRQYISGPSQVEINKCHGGTLNSNFKVLKCKMKLNAQHLKLCHDPAFTCTSEKLFLPSWRRINRPEILDNTVKSQIFVRHLISYFRTLKKVWNFIPDENFFFCLEAIEFKCIFVLRPSKVRKLVRTNQFQVKSTKICNFTLSCTVHVS